MDKVRAEAILELTEPYDYIALRNSWKRLCSDFHPDKSIATGMSEDAANEALKDTNEALEFLRSLVADDVVVSPDSEMADQAKELERAYVAAIGSMLSASNADQLDASAGLFELLGNYGRAQELAAECRRMATAAREEQGQGSGSEYVHQAQESDAIGSYKARKAIRNPMVSDKVLCGLGALLLVVAIILGFRFESGWAHHEIRVSARPRAPSAACKDAFPYGPYFEQIRISQLSDAM